MHFRFTQKEALKRLSPNSAMPAHPIPVLLAFLWVCDELSKELSQVKTQPLPKKLLFCFVFKYKPHSRTNLPGQIYLGVNRNEVSPLSSPMSSSCPLEVHRKLQSQTYKISKLRLLVNTPLNQRTRAIHHILNLLPLGLASWSGLILTSFQATCKIIS